jgi:hypothetical protein
MLNSSWHRPAGGASERDGANQRAVLGRPLQQAAGRIRAFLVYRVAHQPLTEVSTSSVGRPGGGKRHEA